MTLVTYDDFVDRVDELGFMAWSHNRPSCPISHVLPSFAEERDDQWTTDSWTWKDRAVEEKRLAYGYILGGHKGFVSARMYPLFCAAYQPEESIEERWASGQVSQTTWQLWQLFENKTLLNTLDIRHAMGVTRHNGAGRVEASIHQLEREYYLIVAGIRHKVSKAGQPFGWPTTVYETVASWVPTDWMSAIPSIHPEEARETILDHGMSIAKGCSRKELAEALGML
jgi:hypothetical protein